MEFEALLSSSLLSFLPCTLPLPHFVGENKMKRKGRKGSREGRPLVFPLLPTSLPFSQTLALLDLDGLRAKKGKIGHSSFYSFSLLFSER